MSKRTRMQSLVQGAGGKHHFNFPIVIPFHNSFGKLNRNWGFGVHKDKEDYMISSDLVMVTFDANGHKSQRIHLGPLVI